MHVYEWPQCSGEAVTRVRQGEQEAVGEDFDIGASRGHDGPLVSHDRGRGAAYCEADVACFSRQNSSSLRRHFDTSGAPRARGGIVAKACVTLLSGRCRDGVGQSGGKIGSALCAYVQVLSP